MHPTHDAPRRTKKTQLRPELLETRSLMTGGTGNTIAILPGTIATAKEVASTSFTLSKPQFTIPKGKLTLGVDVVPNSSTEFKPQVLSVQDASGRAIRGATRAIFNPGVTRNRDTGDPRSSAMLVPLTAPRGDALTSLTFSAQVTGAQDTTGKFLLGFYLPGDANGDGVVDKTDVKAIRSALRSSANDPKYTFDADADRDGRISNADLRAAQGNLGVKTTVSPLVSANLDPASDSNVADRKTNIRTVRFSGSVTPGASVTFSETAQKFAPVVTTADDAGNYSLMITLGDGENALFVNTQDAFGQSISGGLEPVTFSASA